MEKYKVEDITARLKKLVKQKKIDRVVYEAGSRKYTTSRSTGSSDFAGDSYYPSE